MTSNVDNKKPKKTIRNDETNNITVRFEEVYNYFEFRNKQLGRLLNKHNSLSKKMMMSIITDLRDCIAIGIPFE